jgi:hypothetical protein
MSVQTIFESRVGWMECGGSESKGVADVGLDAVVDGELLDLVGLVGELLLFPGEVGFEASVEFGSEGAVRVGDVVEGAVLLDGAGGALPCCSICRVVGYRSEAAGEIAGRVVGDGVAAGADIAAQRVIKLSFSNAEPRVLRGPPALGGEVGGSLFDAVFRGGDFAAGGNALLLQLFDLVVEVLTFVFVPKGGQHGSLRGDRRELASERVTLGVSLLQLPPVGNVLALEALPVLFM